MVNKLPSVLKFCVDSNQQAYFLIRYQTSQMKMPHSYRMNVTGVNKRSALCAQKHDSDAAEYGSPDRQCHFEKQSKVYQSRTTQTGWDEMNRETEKGRIN